MDDHTTLNDSNSCERIYDVCRTVILNLELTTEDCLSDHDHANDTGASSQTVSSAKGIAFHNDISTTLIFLIFYSYSLLIFSLWLRFSDDSVCFSLFFGWHFTDTVDHK